MHAASVMLYKAENFDLWQSAEESRSETHNINMLRFVLLAIVVVLATAEPSNYRLWVHLKCQVLGVILKAICAGQLILS